MANWFGKSKKGLIFGIWNSHTSLGNILGSIIAGLYVEENWGLSFMVPGMIIGAAGFFLWLFLVPEPSYVGLDENNINVSPPYLWLQVMFQFVHLRLSMLSICVL